MPELPEVETIRRGLQQHVVGFTITDVEVLFPKIISGEVQKCKGAIVQKIRRFGKGLVIDLDNGYSIAVHVKMTGQLVVKKKSPQPPLRKGGRTEGSPPASVAKTGVEGPQAGGLGVFPKHTHVIFKLKNQSFDYAQDKNAKVKNAYLYYNDIRQFGWIKVLKTDDVAELPFFKALGLEPLRDLTEGKFTLILKKNKTPIKSLLMDQQKIAGIGNIYANDALFMAGIHPARSALSLTRDETGKLFAAIENVLQKSIAVGGASASNYVNALGERGTYQEHFLVYKKEGEPCPNCETLITRIKTSGRSTFYCPECQI